VVRHGGPEGVHEHRVHDRVDGGADGLVQEGLDDRVADVELGLDKGRGRIERFLVIGGCCCYGVVGGCRVSGGEGLFQELLPAAC
jgi:hypothetical protein